MLVYATSIISGNERSKEIDVTFEQLDAWHDGQLIQNAMPNVSPLDRDFIKGIFEDEMPLPIDDDDLENLFASNLQGWVVLK